MSTKLTPFSYAVLVLVGEGGAGAHDLVRMMREGQYVFWAAATSQWYAEPKRLAELGYLHAEKGPGRTHARTHYTLTDAGREAVLRSLESLRAPLEETSAALDRLADVGGELPHRAQVIAVNHRFARRILDAHAEWLEEAEAALRDEPGPRG